MRVHVWLAIVCVGLFAQQRTQAAPEPSAVVIEIPRPTPPPPRPVKVRVYRSPEVASDVLETALKVAEATFAAASVNVVWKVCGPSECNIPPAATERLVRLVRAPQGAALDTRCLGDALIDARKGIGVLATVYIDRVVDLAHHLDINHATLLGRTIAHEIGHLLLATNTHSTSGLMRELWSPEELLTSKADDWALRPLEAAAIRKRLTTSGFDNPPDAL